MTRRQMEDLKRTGWILVILLLFLGLFAPRFSEFVVRFTKPRPESTLPPAEQAAVQRESLRELADEVGLTPEQRQRARQLLGEVTESPEARESINVEEAADRVGLTPEQRRKAAEILLNSE